MERTTSAGRPASHAGRCGILGIVLLGVSALACGPASQPAHEAPARESTGASTARSPWATTVAAFANALVEESDPAALAPLVSDRVHVRPFNSSRRDDLAALHAIAARMTVLCARGYGQVPESLASDLADDLRDHDIPDSVKRRLTPGDDADARRANATAARWIAMTLDPHEGESIGVIVLWNRDETPDTRTASIDDPAPADSSASLATPPRLPLFILLKGHRATDGAFQIRQICYGDPLPMGSGAESK
jgi:hypothetical protein